MNAHEFQTLLLSHPKCLKDGDKLRAMLADLYPNDKKSLLNALLLLHESGMVAEMMETAVSPASLNRWCKTLEEDYSLDKTVYTEAISIWQEATAACKKKLNLFKKTAPRPETDKAEFVLWYDDVVRYCGQSSDVVVPAGITKIRREAFCRCENVRSILLPESLLVIGRMAFAECRNLTLVQIPRTVMKKANDAFYHSPATVVQYY